MLSAEADRAPGAPVVAARALILGAAALILVAAGCGDEDDEGSAPASATTDLEVALDADGPESDPPRAETVACEAGDDSPCAALKATDLAPLDPATPCTEIYGGPDEVTVEGSIAGETVSGTLTRANGCEIERFDRFTPLLRELFPGYRPGESLRP